MAITDRQRAILDARRSRGFSREAEANKLAAELRSFYYPKQAAFFESPARLRATRKTRRAGATTGGCRELLARAIETPGFRATCAHSTLVEARARAWENDTQNGLANIVREFGEPLEVRGVEQVRIGGVICEVRPGELALDFSNGSRIELFGADHERATSKKRGSAKHVYWLDEAQDFLHLESFYKRVISPALSDFKGECWITGTPSVECSGMFYDITKQDEVDGPRLPGWDVHVLAQVDNPYFGDTPEERWENTAGEAMRLNGWSADDPDLLREQFALWVRSDGNYVYKVHAVPAHQLCYAPARMDDDGFPDVRAAMEDLPAFGRRTYFTALGADLGTRDDFAFVLWAWALEDPCLYEVASWKKPGLDYDEMAMYLRAVRELVTVGLVVADAGGGGKPAVMGWSKEWLDRYQVPVEEAEKKHKEMAIKLVNNDIRTGKLRVREGGVLLAEWRVHRWAKLRSSTGLRVEDPATPNHAADAALYAHRHSYHHRGKVETPPPPPGTPARLEQEEREVEAALEQEVDEMESPWWS